jgi:hypothetical protein
MSSIDAAGSGGIPSFLMSTIIGALLSLLIILFSPDILGIQKKADSGESAGGPNEVVVKKKNKITEEQRISKLHKMLGASEEDIKNALHGKTCAPDDDQGKVSKRRRSTNKKALKTLGIATDEQTVAVDDQKKVQKGIEKAYEKEAADWAFWIKRENLPPEEINWVKLLDRLIFFVLITGFCYFYNQSTNGQFGRMVAALFPTEFEVMGLKSYLERLPTEIAK